MVRTFTLLVGLTLLLNSCGQKEAAASPGGEHEHHMAMGPQAGCGTTNLAQGKSTDASSSENANFLDARFAVDGNVSTRWASLPSDPQWLQVDLGSAQTICSVTLDWEAAYGKAFKIQVANTSNDAATWTTVYETTSGTGGTQVVTPTTTASGRYIRMLGTQRPGGYGYSLEEFQVFGGAGTTTPPPASGEGWIKADPPVTGVVPSMANLPNKEHKEFQANCSVSRSNLPDDPIIYPGQAGASHMHTFMGNTTTNAGTTLASLRAGGTACLVPGDQSAYWMPTMYNGDQPVQPVGPQVIYYKSGVLDYTSVRPFPPGLRYIVGNMHATAQEFQTHPGYVQGWECGDSYKNADFPACPPGARLNVRMQAPSCWDGLHLDSPDHKRHMAYPVAGRCTASHPVAVPMLEFKMAFPAGSDTSKVRLSSGRGYSFHYDFFNAWDPQTLKAMVDHCIVGGLQCDPRGYDEYEKKGPVLGPDYRLP